MVFSSVTFLFYFLPLFLFAYVVLPWRNAVLLAGSLLFYAWGGVAQLPVLLVCILFNFTAAPFAAGDGRTQRAALWLGVGGNLLLLVYYKYLGFLAAQLFAPLGLPPVDPIALPLGISFFTFQGISYLVDVHRGTVRAETSLLRFAAYKAMFPQLIAGPIVRYASVAKELYRRDVTLNDFAGGAQTFCIGLAQKVLLANTLAVPVDRIFTAAPADLGFATAWFGAAGYALQIYFDFAGYSNMAIGLGRMMGFTFPINFDGPYRSRSVTEFWRRWHMSLSTWFRDYLYVPLGGNRHGAARTYLNLAIVFLLCGFWHGAAWTFVAWGAWHGFLLIVERAGLKTLLARLPWLLQHAYLLLVVVLGWVLFRAEDIPHAAAIYGAMFGRAMFGQSGDPLTLAAVVTPSVATAFVVGAAIATTNFAAPARIARLIAPLQKPAAIAALLLCAFSLSAGTYNPFIYFRF